MPQRLNHTSTGSEDPMRFFARLGESVLSAWKAREYDEAAFPEIVTSLLLECPPSRYVTLEDGILAGLTTDHLPFQEDIEASFGQPPLTVFWHPDFRIELLFWVRSLPGIHQHAFSGAFHVMHGSSLHALWDFECEKRLTSRLLLGRVRQRKAELLVTGEVRTIWAGKEFIHATYHLDCPSITVVVRTNRESEHLPQYLYLPPTIAVDVLRPGPVVKRRIQLLRMLISAGRFRQMGEILPQVLSSTDVFTAFHVLRETYLAAGDAAERKNLLLHVAERHQELAEAAGPALEEQMFRQRIIALREKVNNPDLQFFLALLLNVSAPQTIQELVRARYGHVDPCRRIVGWIREMSALGLLDTKFPEPWFRILEELLRGRSPAETHAVLLGGNPDPMAKEATADVASALRAYWLFRSLFATEAEAVAPVAPAGLSSTTMVN